MALRIDVNSDDFAYGGSDPAQVFSRAIARAMCVRWVLVHRGPLMTPSFETRISQAHSEEATSWFVRVNQESIKLPKRCQIVASFLSYGPGCSRIAYDTKDGKRRVTRDRALQPFWFMLPITIEERYKQEIEEET